MKKLLFVINTLGTGGAEASLVEVLKKIDTKKYDVSLFVLMNQGELVDEIPEGVKLINKDFDSTPVHSDLGMKKLEKFAKGKILKPGHIISNAVYICKNRRIMKETGMVHRDKLAWWPIARSIKALNEKYDLAVAFIEGGATYYVADCVDAEKKVSIVHTDYLKAGYYRELDKDSYSHFDYIFPVSVDARNAFLKVYPEMEARTEVFPGILDIESIERKALMQGGFDDDYEGTRILSIGSLTLPKSFDVSIDAMKRLKDAGVNAKWYVLGEGDQREYLEMRIDMLGLKDDFVLLGTKSNPYPYLKQCDVYVHASRFEGKSIAVQEAQALECPIVVTNCGGNRELVSDGWDGIQCDFDSVAIADAILDMLGDKERAFKMGARARERLIKSLENNDPAKKLTEIAG